MHQITRSTENPSSSSFTTWVVASVPGGQILDDLVIERSVKQATAIILQATR